MSIGQLAEALRNRLSLFRHTHEIQLISTRAQDSAAHALHPVNSSSVFLIMIDGTLRSLGSADNDVDD